MEFGVLYELEGAGAVLVCERCALNVLCRFAGRGGSSSSSSESVRSMTEDCGRLLPDREADVVDCDTDGSRDDRGGVSNIEPCPGKGDKVKG